MPRIHNKADYFVPFYCSGCDTDLGFTSEGEAATMNRRALHYCASCMTAPPGLTDRQQECIDIARRLRVELGRPPLFDEIAEQMGVARSRVSALARSIRERGHGAQWEDALFGPVDEAALTEAAR